MSDPRDFDEFGDGGGQGEQPGADLLGDETEFDAENLQTSTGGGMGPESFPPDDDENFSGNGADRGPS
ncbi:MAG: hypothetical protein WBL06_00215 [Pseudolysinimonas sp.]|jgi:hypothetical protein|uniref:hypothetical protein n=1 Tax=Pseudolysinimonas sp. TaxID=2680009 RepID=UPI003C78DB7E